MKTRLCVAGLIIGLTAAAAFAAGPTIHATPNPVRRGHNVAVYGLAGGCPRGDRVTLISRAFPHTHDFAGLPAIFATVHGDDTYGTTTRIPRTKAPGRYTITARCGGGNFGVTRTLTVLPP
jgi:hypothetical protein